MPLANVRALTANFEAECLDGIPLPVCVTSSEDRIVLRNRAFQRLFPGAETAPGDALVEAGGRTYQIERRQAASGRARRTVHCYIPRDSAGDAFEELQQLWFASDDALFALTGDGEIELANAAAERVLQLPAAALRGRSWVEQLGEADRPAARQRLEQLRARAEPVRLQARLRCAGAERWFSWGLLPVRTVGRVYCVGRDIEEPRQQQRRLAEAEQLLSGVLASAGAGVVVLAPDAGEWEVRFANPAAERTFGVLGPDSWERAVAAGLPEEVRARMAQAARAGEEWHQEIEWNRRILKVAGTPLGGGLVLSFLDVTEARRLATVAERTSNLVVITDAEGRIEWVNAHFVRVTGYTLEEARGRRPASFLHGAETDQATVRRMRAAIRAGAGFREELVNYSKAGEKYWIELDVQPVRTGGAVTNFVAIETEVTERKRSEAALRAALERERQLNEVRTRLIATMSHEFRTPLTVIGSSADLLEMMLGVEAGSKPAQHLGQIRNKVKQMVEMLNELLEVRQAEAENPSPRPGAFDFAAHVSEVVAELRQTAPEGQEIHWEPPAEACPVWLDPKMTRAVLQNLVANAVKYSPRRTPVQVTLEVGEVDLAWTVEDGGIGIPAADLDKVFGSFHRARNVGNIPGTGLGLAIVKRFVEQHGGTIAVASEAGQGTRFRVRLPRRLEQTGGEDNRE